MKAVTARRLLAGSILFGLAYWVFDGVINYIFFHHFLRFLIFERPQSIADSILFSIPPQALIGRISFLTACIVGGLLLFQFETRRSEAETKLVEFNRELELRVHDRTAQLEGANRELESFAYSVSHDLRAPLRAIDGFSRILVDKYAEPLNDKALDYLGRIRQGAVAMGQMIDDILALSRASRDDMHMTSVNLSEMAEDIVRELRQDTKRNVTCEIQKGVIARGDMRLLNMVLFNLIENAWKFTSKRSEALISFGETVTNRGRSFYVTDNGAGFDSRFVQKLFQPFERLHTSAEFPGSGIGLATVHRIVTRHGGEVWAEGKPGEGSTFFFTLRRFPE